VKVQLSASADTTRGSVHVVGHGSSGAGGSGAFAGALATGATTVGIADGVGVAVFVAAHATINTRTVTHDSPMPARKAMKHP